MLARLHPVTRDHCQCILDPTSAVMPGHTGRWSMMPATDCIPEPITVPAPEQDAPCQSSTYTKYGDPHPRLINLSGGAVAEGSAAKRPEDCNVYVTLLKPAQTLSASTAANPHRLRQGLASCVTRAQPLSGLV